MQSRELVCLQRILSSLDICHLQELLYSDDLNVPHAGVLVMLVIFVAGVCVPACDSMCRYVYVSDTSFQSTENTLACSCAHLAPGNALMFMCVPCCAFADADTEDVLLSAAVTKALSEADVVAAVGQLGDNTLTPAHIDMSGLCLDQGECGYVFMRSTHSLSSFKKYL